MWLLKHIILVRYSRAVLVKMSILRYRILQTSIRLAIQFNPLSIIIISLRLPVSRVNLISKNGWVFQNDLNNQSYRGLTDGFNQSFWLWNVRVGKKFLKNDNGELSLTVFDFLKQNQSIRRNVEEIYVEDVQTQVLRQYFMLTFSYRLRNFGSRK